MNFEDSFVCNSYQFYLLHGFQKGNDLILLGKIRYNDNDYKRCTVRVTGLKKTVYVKLNRIVPNLQSTASFQNAIEAEVASISNLSSIGRCEWEFVKRHTIYSHAAEHFLKITYNASKHFICRRNKPTRFIEYVYGLDQNAFVQFLLDKQIKGPSWLDIDIYANEVMPKYPSQITCQVNDVKRQEHCGMETPTFKFVSVDIAYIPVAYSAPVRLQPYLVAIATGTYCNSERRIFVSDKTIGYLSGVHQADNDEVSEYDVTHAVLFDQVKNLQCKSPKEVVEKLRSTLEKEQADVIVCHELRNLCHRFSQFTCDDMKELLDGYIVIDLNVAADEYGSGDVLNRLRSAEFKRSRCEDVYAMLTDASRLVPFVVNMLNRPKELLRLADAMNIWGLLCFTSNLTGCPLNELRRATILKQVEYLLKFEFACKETICPGKYDPQRATKTKIKGSKIINPAIGCVNGKVLTYDFRSLYPSIICEYNLTFANANVECFNLPELISRLMGQRETVGDDVLAGVLKYRMNSIYGCVSSEYSLFYDPVLANRITEYGRNILTNLETLMSPFGTVIYGHTDSIFINVNNPTCETALNSIVAPNGLIHRQYKCIMLKSEGCYAHGIIFGKNQYALRQDVNNWIIKGVFKRNVPQVAQDVFKYFLESLYTDGKVQQIKMIKDIEHFFVNDDPAYYAMHVQLQKSPESYTTDTSYGNVLRRRNATKIEGYEVHDHVSFVICNDGTRNRFTARAYSLEEYDLYKNIDSALPFRLSIDKQYYKVQQVMPLLEKIAKVFPQFNFVPIYSHLKGVRMNANRPMRTGKGRKHVHPFSFQCLNCFAYVILASATYLDLTFCSNCNSFLLFEQQMNAIVDQLRRMLQNLRQKLETAKYWCIHKCTQTIASSRQKCPRCNWYFVASYNEMHFYHQITYVKEQFVFCTYQVQWPQGEFLDLSNEIKQQLVQFCTRLVAITDGVANEILPQDFHTIKIDFSEFYGTNKS